MKTIRSRKGPFAEQPHFTLREIEELCLTELKSVDLLPQTPAAIRIDRFIEKRFNITPDYDDLPEGILGFTAFGPDGPTSTVVSRIFAAVDGDKVLERRLRTTLAHEAGHCLMHAHLFALGEKPASMFDDGGKEPTILCRDVVGERVAGRKYDGRWWEYQANRAIGGLLMPRRLVEEAAKPFVEVRGLLETAVLPTVAREAATEALTDLFDVNPVVCRYRLQEIFPEGDVEQLSL